MRLILDVLKGVAVFTAVFAAGVAVLVLSQHPAPGMYCPGPKYFETGLPQYATEIPCQPLTRIYVPGPSGLELRPIASATTAP